MLGFPFPPSLSLILFITHNFLRVLHLLSSPNHRASLDNIFYSPILS